MRLLLRTREAAAALGVSESQLAKYRREGLLTAIQMPSIRGVRFDAGEVEAFARRVARDNKRPADWVAPRNQQHEAGA